MNAHRLLYHSTLGSSLIKKKKKFQHSRVVSPPLASGILCEMFFNLRLSGNEVYCIA